MIEIITTSFFVFSSLYGGPASVAIADSASTSSPSVLAPKEEKTEINIPNNKDIEKKAREFFTNDPLLVDIARCESHFRQYDTKGGVLRGEVNKADVGLMQINELYHGARAKALGLDLKTPEGNMAYAKYLYESEGGQPWKSSSKCWGQAIKSAPASEMAVK
jgi:hypothetical protein